MMTAHFFLQSFGVPKGSSSWITGGLQVQEALDSISVSIQSKS